MPASGKDKVQGKKKAMPGTRSGPSGTTKTPFVSSFSTASPGTKPSSSNVTASLGTGNTPSPNTEATSSRGRGPLGNVESLRGALPVTSDSPPPSTRDRPQSRPPTSTSSRSTSSTGGKVPSGTIRVGVETEIFLRNNEKDRERFFKELAAGWSQMDKSRSQQAYSSLGKEPDQGYDKWCFTEDYTLEEDSEQLGFGVEMISPILTVDATKRWSQEITNMYRKYISKKYLWNVHDSCGTHIHVSKEGGYTLTELQNIACSVLYFESAFDALMGEGRRRLGKGSIQSSFADTYYLHRQTRAQRIQSIRGTSSILEVISLINPTVSNGNRQYAWNFTYLIKGNYQGMLANPTHWKENPRGRIEFRQPAASRNCDAVLRYIELAYSFIMAASVYGTAERLGDKVPPCVGALREFIYKGFTMYLERYKLQGGSESLREGSLMREFLGRRPRLDMVMVGPRYFHQPDVLEGLNEVLKREFEEARADLQRFTGGAKGKGPAVPFWKD